jgi:hypothetical protein
MRRIAGAVAAVAAIAGCVVPGPQGGSVIEIPLDTVVRGEPGSVHQLTSVPVAAGDVGRECTVAAEGINNESVHPNSDLLVRSGNSEVVIPDVERAPNVRTEASGTLVLGSEVSVAVRLGADGVFSGGGVVMTLDCPEPPAEGPVVTVEPDTGLVDGQTVTVEGTGFTATPIINDWVVVQCSADILAVPLTLEAALNFCDAVTGFVIVSADENGNLSTPFTVRGSFTTTGPQPFTVTCGVTPGDCAILVAQITDEGFVGAGAPITFG